MEAVAYPQGKTFEAAMMFANTEGKLPAPCQGQTCPVVMGNATSPN